MKIFLSSIICITICLNATAQERLALYGGAQFTSAKYLIEGKVQETDYKKGFMGGLGLKVPLEKQLSFFPAVYYSLKGYKVTYNDNAFPPSENALNNNTTIHVLDISPMLQWDFTKTPSHVFFRLGPSIDVAFSGTETYDTLSTSGNINAVTQKMKFSYTSYGKISAAINMQLGYQAGGGFMVFAHYAYGIGSMNNADFGPRIVHRIAGLSVGWLFGGRKNRNPIPTPAP